MDFLINRSGTAQPDNDGKPRVVDPSTLKATEADTTESSQSAASAKAVNA